MNGPQRTAVSRKELFQVMAKTETKGISNHLIHFWMSQGAGVIEWMNPD